MKIQGWRVQLRQWLQKYKYVFPAVLAGVLLLLWPTGEKKPAAQAPAAEEGDVLHMEALESRLEKVLSQVEGAGRVSVILTWKETPRQVVAQDGSSVEGGGESRREVKTVLASGLSGKEEPVVLQQLAPACQGAVVVAQGGGDPRVKLDLSRAVAVLTGLGADKITVCQGK